MKTIEELEDDWKLEEFGICSKCNKRLEHNDKFINISEGECGSIESPISNYKTPFAYIKKSKRYHEKCFKNYE